MHEKFFFLAFTVVLLVSSPVSGSLAKISSTSPVFIGESNLDISSALLDCHTIAWWPNGTPTSSPPAKNLTIASFGQDNLQIFHYTIDPDFFTGYTGPWYCQDKQPPRVVFQVLEPQVRIRAWNLDTNQDVTGTTVTLPANITYRIDTNLYPALQPLNRPDINPLDSFFKVNLTDPRGRGISNIYSGSAGDPTTQIVAFDSVPFISSSPYFWKNAAVWNKESRNAYGEKIYPDGTYTFMVTENLDHLQETYARSTARDLSGITFDRAQVTLVRAQATPTSQPSSTAVTSAPATASIPVTTPAAGETTAPVVTQRTTYSPLPSWIVLLAIIMAGLVLLRRPGS